MNSRFIEIKGINYHYLEFPNPGKPKLLLVHGVIVESHCWEQVIAYLKNEYHIYAIDLKGHGKTDNGKSYLEDYSPEIIAHDFKVFYDKIITEPFYLAGYSLGGQFSMAYAGLYPETLKGFIVLDSAPSVPMKGIFHLVLADVVTPKSFKNKEAVARFYGMGGPLIGQYMADYCVVQGSDDKFRLRFDKKNINSTSLMENMRRNRYLWEQFKAIQAPLLFIKAEKSKLINHSMLMMMKGFKPNMEIYIAPGVGHHELTFNTPKEVAVTIDSFIKKFK